MIELGVKAKDKITGFAGTVTGRSEYLTGCAQYLVAPPVGKDGNVRDSCWFDEQRLTVTGTSRISLDNSRTPGPDKPAPRR